MVAFYDINEEIYKTAEQRANSDTVEDLSDSEDDDQDEDGDTTEEDVEFELDDDVDFTSPFLHSMLSDQRPASSLSDAVVSVAATHVEMKSREPTEEEWENM